MYTYTTDSPQLTVTNFSHFEQVLYSRFKQLGFSGVLITGINYSTKTYKVISNFPQNFINEYCSHKLYLTDPVIQYCERFHSIITWHQVYQFENTTSAVSNHPIAKLCQQSGINHCLAIPISQNGVFGIINLFFDGNQLHFEQVLHQHYTEVVGTSQIMFQHLATHYPEHIYAVLKLTPKEKECLCLIAKGLNNNETSCLMGVSRDRVKELVSNLIRKFGASNRTETVMLAAKSNLV